MCSRRLAVLIVLFVTAASAAAAQNSYVIQNAKVVTVSGPVLQDGSVVIKDGKIADVGKNVVVPSGAKTIDGRGLTVYPGLFDIDSSLGMTGSSPESQFGQFTPQMNASTSFVPESEAIPIARVCGLTHVLARPARGIIPGQGEVMNLAGWTGLEMLVKPRAALLLAFPTVGELQYTEDERFQVTAWSSSKALYDRRLREVKDFFSAARVYMNSKERATDSVFIRDDQYEAMIPVLKRQEPIIIETTNHVDIRNAVQFARDENLNYLIAASVGAWRVADFLKENGVRVIVGSTLLYPDAQDDPYDSVYRTAAILHEKGVPVALSTLANHQAYPRSMPESVGNAVSHGLPYEVAVRSVTLTPAEFLGVADRLGSIDKGKIANLVVATGDIFEVQTQVKHLFINGEPVSVDTKETELYRMYLNRPAPRKVK
jgi:imidazolonepropionase-like amidohydrolase